MSDATQTQLKAFLAHYLRGAAASAFNGGVTALSALIGTAGAHSLGAKCEELSPVQVIYTFLGSAGVAALLYFKANPLPVDAPIPETLVKA